MLKIENRLHLETLIHASGLAAVFTDLNGKITYMSPGAELLSGYSAEEMVGTRPTGIFPRRFEILRRAAKLSEEKRRIINTDVEVFVCKSDHNISNKSEWTLRCKNGAHVFIELTVTDVYDANGTHIGYTGLIYDVTARKTTELELRRSQTEVENARIELEDFIIETNDLIQSLDSDGNILFVNRSWKKKLGYDDAEIAGMNIFDILHPATVPQCMVTFQKLKSGENVGLKELEFVSKSGQVIIVEGNMNSRFEHGKMISTRGIFRDITDKRIAERAFRESEQRLRGIFTHSDVGIGMLDLNFKLTLCNDALAQILGYTHDELMNTPTAEVFTTADRGTMVDNLIKLSSGKIDRITRESQMLRKDGELVWARRTTFSLKDNNNNPYAIVAIVTDISEIKAAETALRQSELKFRSLYDNAPDAYLLMDSRDEGRITSCNHAALKMLRGTTTDVIGKTPASLSPMYQPDGNLSENMVRKHIEATLRNGNLVFEWVHRRVDGEEFWAQVAVAVFPDTDNTTLIVAWRDITDRKQADSKLRLRETQLTSALKLASAGTWEYNVAADEFTFDDDFFAVFRTTYNAVGTYKMTSQQYARRFVHPHDLAVVREGIAVGLSSDDANFHREIEHRFLYADKNEGWMWVRYGVLDRDANGKPVRLYGVNQDITGRKQAEAKLLAEADKNRLLLETASDGIQIYDMAGNLLQASNSFATMLGYNLEEILGLHISNWDATKTKDEVMTALRGFETDNTYQFEAKARCKDGTILDTEVIARGVNVDGTRLIYAASRDVTIRKRAEAKLLAREAELRQILDNINVSVLRFDKNLVFLSANLAYSRLVNRPVNEIIGRTITEIAGEETTARTAEYVKAVLKGEPQHYVLSVKYPENVGITYLQVNLQPEISPDGTIDSFLVNITDITELKHTEEQLIGYQRELERTKNGLEEEVMQRTKTIEAQKNELELRNIAQKKINDELDRFVYSASHDLRAPLTSLLGLIRIIEKNTDQSNKPQMLQLGMMRASVNKMDTFITEILDYSRNNRTHIDSNPIDFMALVMGVQEKLSYMAGFEKIDISVEIRQPEVFVGDRRRLEIIISNLFSNAIKYSDTTKPESHVKIRVWADETHATFEVEDNGIGIAEKDQKSVFEMFFRATTKSDGSGVGLYIVKETVEKLQGKINLKSELHKGSVFTIEIPQL